MRVLMIRTSGGVSGAERYNLSLVLGLKREYDGPETVFITDNEEFRKRLGELGVHVYLLGLRLKEVGTKREFLQGVIVSPYLISTYLMLIRQIEKSGKI